MLANGISREILESAANAIGVKAEIRATSNSGRRFRVKLYPIVPREALTKSGYRRKGECGDAPYQRISASAFSNDRRVHAVCWHGFRDYFRACFSAEPEAIFRTALDTWRGLEDFEARFRNSGGRNVGSQVRPVASAHACRCSESGELDDGEPAPILQPDPRSLAIWHRLNFAGAVQVIRAFHAEASRSMAYVPEFAKPLATVAHAGAKGSFRCGATLGDSAGDGRVTCRVCAALER